MVSATADPDPAQIEEFITEFNLSFVPPEREESDQGEKPERIEIGGYTIQYLKAGSNEEGIPILMIHGFSSSHTIWMLNQAELSAEHTVYAIDLPGHGGSTKQIETADSEALTECISEFLQTLNIPKVHLVGHSLGD